MDEWKPPPVLLRSAALTTPPPGRGLHSSTFSAERKHFLWDVSSTIGLSVTKMAQAELKTGRV